MATKQELADQLAELGGTPPTNLDDVSHEELQRQVTEARGDQGSDTGNSAGGSSFDSEGAVKDAAAEAIAKVEPDRRPSDVGVGDRDANRDLEHTQGGTTTRADSLDAGVPMLQGDASEPQGPEDALGTGIKRGDYSNRVDAGPHLESVPVPGGSQPIRDPDTGAVIDYSPNATLVAQAPRVEDIGDEPGKKGGVTT